MREMPWITFSPGACAEDHADLFKSYVIRWGNGRGQLKLHRAECVGRPHAQNRSIKQVNHGASIQSVAVAVPTRVLGLT